MPFYRGDSGKFEFSETGSSLAVITALRNWTLTVEKDEIETTAQGDNFRKYVGGMISATGTAEMLFDAGSGKKEALLDDIVEQNDDATAAFKLYFNDTQNISFVGLITSSDYGVTVGEVTSASVSFRATGAITMDVA